MPKMFTLTQATVERAACPPGRKDALLFDSEVRGFGLRVTPSGKNFLVQYRTAGRVRRLPIGRFGTLTVKEARQQAKAILGSVAGGADPLAERRAAETAARAKQAHDAFTFGTLIEEWRAARADKGRRESYLAPAVATLRGHLADWFDRPAGSITTAEAMHRLTRIKTTTGTGAANHVLSYARAAFGWAVRQQKVPANPFTAIEAPGDAARRERVPDMEEVAAIWRAAESLPAPYAGFVRVLLLTLQRRGEVAAMRWDELSANMTTWTLPGARAKNGRAHVVHLAEPVRAILAAQPRIKGCPYVFPGGAGRPVAAFSKTKLKLDRAITAERTQAGLEPAELPEWTMHDFRRSGPTALAGMGFPPHVCDRLLNHVGGTISGVALIYQKAEFLAERKAALDAWAAHVLAAVEGPEMDGKLVLLARMPD